MEVVFVYGMTCGVVMNILEVSSLICMISWFKNMLLLHNICIDLVMEFISALPSLSILTIPSLNL